MIITIICGTRPEFVKLSPVIKELQKRGTDFFILHTGQHYTKELDMIFFEQLKIPQPKYNLKVGSFSATKQTAKMMLGLESVLLREKPNVVLVLGDTNSVFAGAFVANKLKIKVGHIEAGLRSYDSKMPEEINRILVDHCADLLFAPTDKARYILYCEGISTSKIFMTGNTIVDAVRANLKIAQDIKIPYKSKSYFLATIHRAENVDVKERFENTIESLKAVSKAYQLPIVYPIHPHSLNKAKEFGLSLDGIDIIEPLDYFQFLKYESESRLVLTDSGGVQEETCIIGVPCVTLRDNTERPETLEVGSNMLSGVSKNNVLECVDIMFNKKNEWDNPFGDGLASKRIVGVLYT